MAIEVFKRFELKYIITKEQQAELVEHLHMHMNLDTYGDNEGKYNIVSLYYESDDFDIYNETVNRLRFRQKLRLRVYDDANLASSSFIEVKQKFKNVVNKRRSVIPLHEAYDLLNRNDATDEQMLATHASNYQILKEAVHFKQLYSLHPKSIVSYDRQAFTGINEPDLRVTFDYNLRTRADDLRVENGPYGELILDENLVILEVKISNSVPFWLSRILSNMNLSKQGFSKYCTSIDLIEEFEHKHRSVIL